MPCEITLGNAHVAAAWAADPCADDPSATNYDRVCDLVLDAVRKAPSGQLVGMPDMAGLEKGYWPFLSRMLVMGNPGLAGWINPSYCEALDNQSGASWLQIKFKAITGHKPLARSWRHAAGCEEAASL